MFLLSLSHLLVEIQLLLRLFKLNRDVPLFFLNPVYACFEYLSVSHQMNEIDFVHLWLCSYFDYREVNLLLSFLG